MQNPRPLSRTNGVRGLDIESFNGRMRDDLLNETMFRSPVHARAVIADWVAEHGFVEKVVAHPAVEAFDVEAANAIGPREWPRVLHRLARARSSAIGRDVKHTN